MTPELDSELLRTFVAIVDTGSFTKAASVVNRTQSAVSMQMKRLEEVAGSTIFCRDGRSVKLTRQGETLQRYARKILKMQAEALSALKQKEFSGKVTLGIPDDYVDTYLPEFLLKLNQQFPRVEVNVVCQESSMLRSMLEKNKLDLAIMSRHPELVLEGEIPLRHESVVWVTSRQNIAHEQNPLPLAMFGKQCIFRRWAVAALDEINRAHRVAYSSQSLAGILAYVRAGIGVTVLAESSVTADLRILSVQDDFPLLPDITLVVSRAPANTSTLIDQIEQKIINSFSRVQQQAA